MRISSKKVLVTSGFLASVFVLGVFVVFNFANASTYSQGTVLKSATGNSVYYISSDGRKFPFPNAQTYRTWYSDFKNIKRISDDALKKIKNGSRFVTVRPGTKLVKFDNSKGVYVVLQGAYLKKLTNVEDARGIYGSDWYKKVIVLPSNLISSYTIHEDIEDPEDYSPIGQRNAINSINDSLIARRIVARPGRTYEDNSVNFSRLKLIQENFADSFSPRFNSFVYSYSLKSKYSERILSLKPLAYSEGTVIKIDGLIARSGVSQGVRLQEGINIIKIEVKDPGKEFVTYNITVYRESADANSRLSKMEENLKSHNFEPGFSSTRYDYKLKADYGESYFKMRFSTYGKYTQIFINGRRYSTGSSGYTFNLDYGENKYRIYVVAQDGSSHTYNLVVDRSPYKNLKDASLSSIKINLANGLEPVFNYDVTNYAVYARSSESVIKVRAYPMNSNAIVAIDSKITSYVEYGIGKYRLIEIEVVSPDGLKRKYRIKVYKE